MPLLEEFARHVSETSELCVSCESLEAKPKQTILQILSNPIKINKAM